MFDYQTLLCIILQEIPIYKVFCRISNAMFDIVQKFLQSHSVFDVRKIRSAGCQWYEVKRSKSIFADKRYSETRFGAPFNYLEQFSFCFIKPISSSISYKGIL